MEKTSTNSTIQTIITILKWVLSIFVTLLLLGTLFSKSFFSALILLLVATLLFPPTTEFWRAKLPFLKNRIIKIVIVFALFITGLAVNKDFNKTSRKPKEETKSEQIVTKSEVEKDVETIPTIKHEIVYELNNIRFDKAPIYFVLIDDVDLSNDKFKRNIKSLIDQIVTENGAKISIDILDNKNALELMYKSHYGANTLGRILNKKELSQLERHSIASFSGELETDMYLNTLYFFASATKNSLKVGKYVDIIEYNPIVKDNKVVKEQKAEINEQKELADKKKKDFEKNYFSSWDGSNRELVKLAKANMNDRKSFEHVATTYTTLDDYAVVIMKFRGENALGNTVLNSVKAKISYDGKVLEVFE